MGLLRVANDKPVHFMVWIMKFVCSAFDLCCRKDLCGGGQHELVIMLIAGGILLACGDVSTILYYIGIVKVNFYGI